jgi:FtsH-binding integral membrane protein
MKKYKNTLLSLGCYIIAVLIVYLIFASAPSLGPDPYYFAYLLWIGFILVPVGIFFGFKSDKQKESSWCGNLLMIVGVLLLFPVAFYLGFGGLAYTSDIMFFVLMVSLIVLVVRWLSRLSKKGPPKRAL